MVISNITLSIIIPTINRKEELLQLLQSIEEGIGQLSCEILIIDQNRNGYLDSILVPFKSHLIIKYYNVDFAGLSKAKNFGSAMSEGKWLCFPDDDCEMFLDTVHTAIQFAEESNSDIVFGKCIDRDGNDSVMKFRNENSVLTVKNMIGGFVEATGFARREVFEVFKFDETLGAGCFHGAEEGYDWLYRLLNSNKYKVTYNPSIKFYHPQIIKNRGDQASIKRVFTYRCGFAKLCYKHKLHGMYFNRLFKVLIGAFFFLITFRYNFFKYYLAEFLGLIVGRLIH